MIKGEFRFCCEIHLFYIPMKPTRIAFFLILMLAFSFCDKEEEQQDSNDYTLLVYGRAVCSNCEAFMRKCDKDNIEYSFYDIDKDSGKRDEMQQKLWAAGMGNTGSVTLPIVDLILADTSYLFENPDFQQVVDLLP